MVMDTSVGSIIGPQLTLRKVVNQGFNVQLAFFLDGRSRQRMVGFIGAFRHILQTLLDDADSSGASPQHGQPQHGHSSRH